MGALGALLFNALVFPYMLSSPYFENYQFIKDFKQGKIVINQKESVYIQENTALQEAIDRVKKSVVVIQSPTRGLVSGFIASSDGNIITLADAVGAGGAGSVFFEGQPVTVTSMKIDLQHNLALLKIDKNNLQTVGFASPDSTKMGQRIFLVAPAKTSGDAWLANEGIIREIEVLPNGFGQVIKTNMKEAATANGSPLFNVAGQLVGLNMVDVSGNISAISVNSIQGLLGL